jgi:hypothetical protein
MAAKIRQDFYVYHVQPANLEASYIVSRRKISLGIA